MQVLSGPWAEGALFLRHVESFLPLWMFGLLLFLSVCLLLLQLIVYFNWKLRQVEAHITRFPRDRRAPYRPHEASGHVWRRRSIG